MNTEAIYVWKLYNGHFLFQAIENCSATAGFSSGEFASLVFSGALSFEDGKF